MITSKQIRYLFLSMGKGKQVLVTALAAVFIVSVFQLAASQITIPFINQKNVFVEGIVGHIKIINPLFTDFNDADRDLSQLVFSGLMRYDPIQKNFFPDLAEKWEKTSNGKVYTLTLRNNAKWHDGAPVTAEDILFTFKDVIQDPGFKNRLLASAFEGVTIEAKENNQIIFTLPRSNSYFISNLTVGIIPKHIFENTPIREIDKSGKTPVGSGPYKITYTKLKDSGDIVDLAYFEGYYGVKPALKNIRFLTFKDYKAAAKEKDAIHGISKLIQSENSGKILSDKRFADYKYTLNQFTALFLNTDHPLIKERKFRQALALAINKNELLAEGQQRVDTIGLGSYENDLSFIFNPDSAGKILDSMGLKIGKDGFRVNGKGEIVSLNLLTLEKTPKELTEKIRNMWQSIGIKMQITRSTGKEFEDMVNERNYAILLIKQNLGYNRDVYPIFHSSQVGGVNMQNPGLNYSNFKSFKTDGLTEALRKEQNPLDKQKLLMELSKSITEEIPVIFLSTPVYSYALDKRMQPFTASNLDFHSDRLIILPYLSFPNL